MFGTSTLSAVNMVAGVSQASGPAITWLLPVVYVILGLPIAFVIIWSIIDLYKQGLETDRVIAKAKKVLEGGHYE